MDGDVEIQAEFIWSCYSSSLVKVRWSWLTNGNEDSGTFTDDRAIMDLAGSGEHLCQRSIYS
jgi:hypothetical protein